MVISSSQIVVSTGHQWCSIDKSFVPTAGAFLMRILASSEELSSEASFSLMRASPLCFDVSGESQRRFARKWTCVEFVGSVQALKNVKMTFAEVVCVER